MRKYNRLTLMVLLMNILAIPAMAEDGSGGHNGMAAALGISIAAFGGAIGQGLTASAGVGGVARNPSAQNKIMPMMIIGLALIESLVILSFLIANGLK